MRYHAHPTPLWCGEVEQLYVYTASSHDVSARRQKGGTNNHGKNKTEHRTPELPVCDTLAVSEPLFAVCAVYGGKVASTPCRHTRDIVRVDNPRFEGGVVTSSQPGGDMSGTHGRAIQR